MACILVVDDEAPIRELVSRALGRDGHDVVGEGDPLAVERADLSRYDLLFVDVMMPGMDGYEATRAIRLSKKADAADIPIIALTANAFAEDAKAAHDAGMNAHLSKPLDFNKLKNILACIKKNGSFSL